MDADLLGELPLVEPRVPELTNELIDLGLVAAPARALDVMHPSLSPDSEQIGNHGVHRTLTRDFGKVVPLRITLTPDAGSRVVVDAEVDNTSVNPAVVEVPVTFPINSKVTVHAWTR